jgi:hypothetical protein
MHSRMWTSVGLLFVLGLLTPRLGRADESILGYRAVIVGRWGREQSLGVYNTYELASRAAFDWSAAHPRNYSLWNIDELPYGHRTRADVEIDARNTLAAARRANERINLGGDAYWRDLDEQRRTTALKRGHESLRQVRRLLVELRRMIAFEHPQALQSDTIDRLIGRFNDSAIRFNRLSSIFGSGLPMLDAIPNLKNELPVANVAEASEPTPLSLAGRTLVGTIGGAEVALVFDERSFRVTGDLAGNGVWKSNASGVSLETRNSIYRGVVTGYFAPDRIQGFRYFKDHRASEEFLLRVTLPPQVLTGRWKLVAIRNIHEDVRIEEGKLWWSVLSFDQAGTAEVTTENSAGDVAERTDVPKGTFGWEGEELTFTAAGAGASTGRRGVLEPGAQTVWRRIR